ncbi:MAG: hypothetical protein V1900_01080 [Candidatus Aenigmatarchaeota archaeon]
MFVARMSFPNREPPVRAYVHKAGLAAYGDYPIEGAKRYLLEVLDNYQKECAHYNLILAALWGDNGSRMIDFFGFSNIGKRWDKNPDISAWVIKDGLHIPKKEITCGDTLIALGREEECRRFSSNALDYMRYHHDLGELEPKISELSWEGNSKK